MNVYTCYEVNIESTCVQESVGVNIIEKSTNTSSQVNIGCSSYLVTIFFVISPAHPLFIFQLIPCVGFEMNSIEFLK